MMPRNLLVGTVSVVISLAVYGSDLADAGIDIYVDKSSQVMTVDVNGVRQYSWKISTGLPAHDTPSGSFQPFRMERDHFSREFDDAPMPYSIFFTPRGHAIHGSVYTRRLGTVASRGCVRLSPENASTLFSLVEREGMSKTSISIAGDIGDEPKMVTDRSGARTQPLPASFWLRERSW